MTTIAICKRLIEAQILQATLGGRGIKAYLPEERLAKTSGKLSNYAIGGLRVQVEDDDVTAAREILATFGSPSDLPKSE